MRLVAGRIHLFSVSLALLMPFTYAHPALVVPLVRHSDARGWRSALVLGAMSPDLGRMIPLWGTRDLTHSLSGFLLVDTPLAILLALVWSLWFAPRAIRLPGLEAMEHPWSRRSWILIPLGALLGGLTHLGWDLLTHGPTFVHLPFLDKELFRTASGPFLVRDTNWFLQSFAGLAVLAWGAIDLVRRSPGGMRSLLNPCWARLLLAVLFPLSAMLTWVDPSSPHAFTELYQAVFRSGTGKAIHILEIATLLVFAVFWWETRPHAARVRQAKV